MARYMKRQTITELKSFMRGFLIRNSDVADDIQTAIICLEECVGTAKIRTDLAKYFTHIENVIVDTALQQGDAKKYFYDNFNLLGYQQIKGKVFYGVLGGYDYTLPIYFVLYQDDKGILRGYIPSKGNTINPFGNEVLGAYAPNDDKFANSCGFNNLQEMEEALYPFLNEELLLREIDKRLKIIV